MRACVLGSVAASAMLKVLVCRVRGARMQVRAPLLVLLVKCIGEVQLVELPVLQALRVLPGRVVGCKGKFAKLSALLWHCLPASSCAQPSGLHLNYYFGSFLAARSRQRPQGARIITIKLVRWGHAVAAE